MYYLCITNQNKEYMKIELKNIKVNLTFSQETVNFIADLFVDGIKVASCENSGWGGYTAHGSNTAVTATISIWTLQACTRH